MVLLRFSVSVVCAGSVLLLLPFVAPATDVHAERAPVRVAQIPLVTVTGTIEKGLGWEAAKASYKAIVNINGYRYYVWYSDKLGASEGTTVYIGRYDQPGGNWTTIQSAVTGVTATVHSWQSF